MEEEEIILMFERCVGVLSCIVITVNFILSRVTHSVTKLDTHARVYNIFFFFIGLCLYSMRFKYQNLSPWIVSEQSVRFTYVHSPYLSFFGED